MDVESEQIRLISRGVGDEMDPSIRKLAASSKSETWSSETWSTRLCASPVLWVPVPIQRICERHSRGKAGGAYRLRNYCARGSTDMQRLLVNFESQHTQFLEGAASDVVPDVASETPV